MQLYQPDKGYSYNSDSLFLYDFISSFSPKGRVLDIGAGSGILGLLVARDYPKIELEAVEKQKIFVTYAQHNARVNKIKYVLHETDFLDFYPENKYDYIISNPPFYPEGVKKSDNTILFNARYNSNLPIESFFKKVTQILKPHSHFIFCYDASQFSLLCQALEKVNLKIIDVRFVHPNVNKGASLVMIHARNGSKSLMKVLAPLVVMNEDKITEEVQYIYDKSKTQSIKCQL